VLDSLILLISSITDYVFIVPYSSNQGLLRSESLINNRFPPQWAQAWFVQGFLIPTLFILIPTASILYPAPCISIITFLSLLHVFLQAVITNFKDLADHILLGPRGASGDFYDGPPGQRVYRIAIALMISTFAYFVSIHMGGTWHLFALCITAISPISPAFATAKFIEGGLTDKRMRSRLWLWWWAN
jgi:hypothetical protein